MKTVEFAEKPELVIPFSFEERALTDKERELFEDDSRFDKPTRIIEGVATLAGIDDNYVEVTEDALRAAQKDLLSRTTILENHDTTRPIGRVLDCYYDERKGVLMVKGLISETENDVWKKIREGVLNKFSISWMSMDVDKEFDDDLGREKLVVGAMRIFEVSVVSVPAQAAAEITSFVERALRGEGFEEPANRAAPYSEHFVPAFKRDPTAPKGRKWSATSAIKRARRKSGGPNKSNINWEEYSRFFALVVPDGTRFGDYKYPIRDVVRGKRTAVWHALTNAAGRLVGAENLPPDVRQKIAKRLVKEYRDLWDEEPSDKLLELAGD